MEIDKMSEQLNPGSKSVLDKMNETPKTKSDKKKQTNVLVTIPCYNTEESIANVILSAAKYSNKVIVIDDGSSDMTAEIAKSLNAQVISLGANRGYGQAINTCFETARANDADILVIIDGDGQHEPNEIPWLLNPILQDIADIVIGSRFLNNLSKMPNYRKFGIIVINFLWNIGSKVKVTDSQSGFRAYNKNVIGKMYLTEKGMSASIEIIEKTRKMHFNVKEVPISCSYENDGSIFRFKVLKQGIGVAISVLKIRLKYAFPRKASNILSEKTN